jgi:hemerythrin-like domain-containing protein
MNALDLLKQQHEEVTKLFKQFKKLEEGSTAERRELFVMIADRLSAHATIEEQYFYPSIKAENTEELLREAVEEHLAVKRILADLLEMEPADENFNAKMTVIMENVEHHIEEEETELFKLVKKVLSEDQLLALGVQMMAEYEELLESEPRNVVPMETDTAAPV